ncbi:hypothetical protein BDV11DRAFT_166648 [Aspergillus similis]
MQRAVSAICFRLRSNGRPHGPLPVRTPTTSDIVIVGAGVASGLFDVSTLTEEDCNAVHPYGSHPAVLVKIRMALSEPRKCRLLQNCEDEMSRVPYIDTQILAQIVPGSVQKFKGLEELGVMPRKWFDSGINLRYVGTVISKRLPGNAVCKNVPCFFGLDEEQESEDESTSASASDSESGGHSEDDENSDEDAEIQMMREWK